MADLDLDALAALEAAATEGEWILDTADVNARFHVARLTAEALRGEDPAAEVAWGDYDGNVRMRPADAALIVALRNAAPALIAAARDAVQARHDVRIAQSDAARWMYRTDSAESERDAAQAALDATVVTARNRLDEIHRLRAELETAQAALAPVKALHWGRLGPNRPGTCNACNEHYPCTTIRAVAGEGQEAGGK